MIKVLSLAIVTLASLALGTSLKARTDGIYESSRILFTENAETFEFSYEGTRNGPWDREIYYHDVLDPLRKLKVVSERDRVTSIRVSFAAKDVVQNKKNPNLVYSGTGKTNLIVTVIDKDGHEVERAVPVWWANFRVVHHQLTAANSTRSYYEATLEYYAKSGPYFTSFKRLLRFE